VYGRRRGNGDGVDLRVPQAVFQLTAPFHAGARDQRVQPRRVGIANNSQDAQAVERAYEFLAPAPGADDGNVRLSGRSRAGHAAVIH
jgi:hypothetical protein